MREVEVGRIAAEECSLKFRYKHKPNVRVLLVSIKIVLSALIERNDVRSKACRFQRLGFNSGDLCAACGKCICVRTAGLNRTSNSRRYVFNAHQHVQFKTRRLYLFSAGACDET